MDVRPMAGGRTYGATGDGQVVIRRGGPWSASVHTVLRYLQENGFDGAPVSVGFDDDGREILTHLPGQTVGGELPWPAWVYSDSALIQTGRWLRRLHDVTRSFVPPADAQWFAGQQWSPGLVIGHHDAAPYNAVWDGDRLAGFIDWDTAGPSTPDLDLAFTALTWVPLDTEPVARARGFDAFHDRRRRLHVLLDAYGYAGDRSVFGQIIIRRALLNASTIRRLAGTGDPVYLALTEQADDLEQAAAEIQEFPAEFWVGARQLG